MKPGRGRVPRLEVHEESPAELAAYARVPIAFEVTHVLEIAEPSGGVERTSGMEASALRERRLDAPYIKDYDAIPEEVPTNWPRRFDLSNWGLLRAEMDGERVGGAALAFDTPGVIMLENRRDLAVLWDLRVIPEARGRGVGSALFRAAEAWATARNCRQLKAETQNINVPACRFYRKQGCILGGIRRFVYPALPGEVQLLWYRNLGNDVRRGVG